MSSRLVASRVSRNVVRQMALRGINTRSSARGLSSLSSSSLSSWSTKPTVTSTAKGNMRFFSDSKGDDATAAATENVEEQAAAPAEGEEVASSPQDEQEKQIVDLQQQIKDMNDRLLRSFAEQENTRKIAQRDVSKAKNFAVQSFAKSLLDTSDNLSRALEAVPEEFRADKENYAVLANLYEGIVMTDQGLTKAFEKNGLKSFGAPGEVFDPNRHEALYEYPDPSGTPGTVGQVMKSGFSLNDRVVRPAEVGVVKKV